MSAVMPTYTVLEVSGADAGDFLRSQLTVDVPHDDTRHHVLAAWCDARGRALCTLRVVPTSDAFLLILPADLASTITRRLQMYVLRARVEIRDCTGQWHLSGVLLPGERNDTDRADGALASDANGHRLFIDTGGGPGELRLQPTPADDGAIPVSHTAWQMAEIDAGLPEVTAAISGGFVPQMLNLHWLGGIDFHKGCYPGQEIIARLHYRGRLTRRMFRMAWQGAQPAPGDDVFDGSGTRQGTVLRAAQTESGRGRLLAVVRLDAAGGELSSPSATLSLLDLPYATDEPVPVT